MHTHSSFTSEKNCLSDNSRKHSPAAEEKEDPSDAQESTHVWPRDRKTVQEMGVKFSLG